jgi:hypothetical protein
MNIIKISIFATLMAGFIIGTTIKEKKARKKAQHEQRAKDNQNRN